MRMITTLDSAKNALFDQAPGFLGILTLESKLLTVNKTGLEWIGFNSNDSIVDVGYENLRCKAAEDAALFVWQDELVKRSNYPIYFLGCYCYAEENWRTIFGKKYLIQDENNQDVGIVSQFDDISRYQLVDVSRFVIAASQKFIDKKRGQQFCFLLNDYIQDYKFSTRELECLFFVLRGKTNKGIAGLLNLSPRTVESYIDQIKFKMGCLTREELIEKSIYLGYINILPLSLLEKNII